MIRWLVRALAPVVALAGMGGALAAPQSMVWLAPGAQARVVARVGPTPQAAARYDPAQARFAADARLVALGRELFHDARLSDPPGTACASCHNPGRAFGPDLRRGLQAGERSPGTALGSRPGHFGTRSAPSLLYVRYVPRRYFYQDDDAPAPVVFGGLMADGSADTLAEQVRAPLLNPDEMNNRNPAHLLQRLRANGVAQSLVGTFGPAVRSRPEALLRALGTALAAYLQSDELAPFSSRFDQHLRGQAALTEAERRGLALFKNPDKGNCASCHSVSDTASRPERSLFTDFGYEALAAPRNRALTPNRDPRHFDHGLCRTARQLRWPEPEQWCGYVRTPGLRNVALRQSFMHNGSLKSLREVLDFYNTRGTDPRRWYGNGALFDDVAPRFHGNVNVNSPPINRRPGMPEALSDAEINDLIAFLRSLTDARYVGAMSPEQPPPAQKR
ncbi:MAG: c-type cytochrome [Proteobacteria bacterium]|nr:c-type cytochrome [Pseudomonadota bacterium]